MVPMRAIEYEKLILPVFSAIPEKESEHSILSMFRSLNVFKRTAGTH